MSRHLVIVGASTGGPRALTELFSQLPVLDAAFIIVLHVTPGLDSQLVQHLSRTAVMPVTLAQDGESFQPGHIYLAPGGKHLKIAANRGIVLSEGERVNFVQPSVDVAMLSLVKPLPGKVIGIILTGMGADGAQGIRHVKQIGAITIAQDQKSSSIYGMPKAAAETGAVDFVLSPQQIVAKLRELLPPLRSMAPAAGVADPFPKARA